VGNEYSEKGKPVKLRQIDTFKPLRYQEPLSIIVPFSPERRESPQSYERQSGNSRDELNRPNCIASGVNLYIAAVQGLNGIGLS
jgi:hypothetical protein